MQNCWTIRLSTDIYIHLLKHLDTYISIKFERIRQWGSFSDSCYLLCQRVKNETGPSVAPHGNHFRLYGRWHTHFLWDRSSLGPPPWVVTLRSVVPKTRPRRSHRGPLGPSKTRDLTSRRTLEFSGVIIMVEVVLIGNDLRLHVSRATVHDG